MPSEFNDAYEGVSLCADALPALLYQGACVKTRHGFAIVDVAYGNGSWEDIHGQRYLARETELPLSGPQNRDWIARVCFWLLGGGIFPESYLTAPSIEDLLVLLDNRLTDLGCVKGIVSALHSCAETAFLPKLVEYLQRFPDVWVPDVRQRVQWPPAEELA